MNTLDFIFDLHKYNMQVLALHSPWLDPELFYIVVSYPGSNTYNIRQVSREGISADLHCWTDGGYTNWRDVEARKKYCGRILKAWCSETDESIEEITA